MPKSLAEYLSEVRRAIPIGTQQQDAQANTTAPINNKVDLSTYRPISAKEKELLLALLHRSGPAAEVFLPQLEGMLVCPDCTCGCPTMSLAIADEHPRASFRGNIVADMLGEASDGTVGLLVFQAGGKLTCLEAYDLAGRKGRYSFPPAEAIYPYEKSKPSAKPGAESLR
jgi:hypothetical protein